MEHTHANMDMDTTESEIEYEEVNVDDIVYTETPLECVFVYTSMYHTDYDALLRRTLHRIYDGPGILNHSDRHYIALMAATRHRCFSLMNMHKLEFIRAGGDIEWLSGLRFADAKYAVLDELNMVLAHQPWMCTAAFLQRIARPGSPSPSSQWSLVEVSSAAYILAHTHGMCSLIYAIGDIEPTDLKPAEMDFLKCDDEEYQAKNKENDAMGEVADLLRRMAGLEEASEEAEGDDTFNNAINDMELLGGDSPDSSADGDDSMPVFSGDPHFSYVDFNSRADKSVKTFKFHEFTWDHAFNVLADLAADLRTVSQMLDKKFIHSQSMTYSFMGNYEKVDTRKYRMAVWNYIQALFGVRYDDYEYSEVNVLLDKPTKTFIKHMACSPHKLSDELRSVMNGFKISEKVHVIILVMEARLQATMLHYARAVSNLYTILYPRHLHQRPLD